MKQAFFLITMNVLLLINVKAQNVGINTTNPNRPLTIRAGSGNNELLSLRDTSDNNLWHINMLNDGLNFARTGIADGRLFLADYGSVGIGTTNPLGILHLKSNYPLSGVLESSSALGTWLSMGNTGGGKWFNLISTGTSNGEGDGKLLINSGSQADISGPNIITFNHSNRFTGIGTTSPGARLHLVKNDLSSTQINSNSSAVFENNTNNFIQVSSGAAYSSGIISATANTGLRSGVLFKEDSSLQFLTGGSVTSAVLTREGSAGVGTTSPIGKLHINSGNYLTSVVESSSMAGTWLALGNTGGGNWFQLIATGSQNNQGAGKMIIARGADASSTIDNSAILSMVHSTANVGIGTASPVYKLDVQQSGLNTVARFKSDGTTSQIYIENATDTAQVGVRTSGDMYLGTLGDKNLALRTNQIDRITIAKTTGYAGFGTNSPGVSADINGAIATSPQLINVSGPSATVNPGNRSYLRLHNTSLISTIITLVEGQADGQILIIKITISSAGNVQFFDAAANNTQLNSNYLMTTDDTLTLIWDAASSRWVELHRSVN